MAGEGNELTIFGFDKSERRTMLGFIMKRGFSPNLPFWSTCLAQIFSPIQYGQRPIAYMTLFMQCILEQKRDSSTFSNGIPKSALLNMMDGVDIPIERVLQTVGLHSRVAAVVYNGQEVCSDEEAALAIASRVRIALSYGALEFTSTRLWAPNHDAILLKAVVRHGYGLWKKIIDEAKGLRERVVEECGDKESPEDWIKIRIEGLDRAFRIAEDHEKAQRREVYVEGLKRKLITQYNKITSCISKKPRENPLQLEEIMAGYKSMFEEISGIQ